MSYIQFRQACEDCKHEWNAAFGIVGTTFIAQPPEVCPFCKSERIRKIADGWTIEPITGAPVLKRRGGIGGGKMNNEPPLGSEFPTDLTDSMVDIDTLGAGPTLDIRMAEVMGWRVVSLEDEEIAKKQYCTFVVIESDGIGIRRPLNNAVRGWCYDNWRPSKDIAVAWEVVNHMTEKGWCFRIFPEPKRTTAAIFWPTQKTPEEKLLLMLEEKRDDDIYVDATAPTAPLAICHATLKAVSK